MWYDGERPCPCPGQPPASAAPPRGRDTKGGQLLAWISFDTRMSDRACSGCGLVSVSPNTSGDTIAGHIIRGKITVTSTSCPQFANLASTSVEFLHVAPSLAPYREQPTKLSCINQYFGSPYWPCITASPPAGMSSGLFEAELGAALLSFKFFSIASKSGHPNVAFLPSGVPAEV